MELHSKEPVSIKDGTYTGFISGHYVTIPDFQCTFMTINGVRGMNIPCKIVVKNFDAIVTCN